MISDDHSSQHSHPQVLGCPDCPFVCASNNQMCRHMFLTCHGIYKCDQCNGRLVCWAFAPGAQKLFARAKKEGVIIDCPTFETPEKHQDRTGHVNLHVPSKERFLRPGAPEDYNLVTPKPPTQDSAPTRKYNCWECSKLIGTWTQMTKHLDSTGHSLARCAECDAILKCYGITQPIRHEKVTHHRALTAVFRMKSDYASTARGIPYSRQYYCPDCRLFFLSSLHMLLHLVQAHNCIERALRCADCGTQGTLDELVSHRVSSGHEHYQSVEPDGKVVPLALDQYVAGLPEPNPLIEDITSANCAILYQCPECYLLATSWPVFERHLFSTKHTLAYCTSCRFFLRPLGLSDQHHRYHSGHPMSVCGTQLQKTDYEVLVDLSDHDLQELIRTSTSELTGSMPSEGGQTMYQCPLRSCLELFANAGEIADHFSVTKHGVIQCTCCDQEQTILCDQWKKHIVDDDTPAEIRGMQSTDMTCQVWVPDRILLAHHADKFERCSRCGLIIQIRQRASHTSGSGRCQAARHRQSLQEAAASQKNPEILLQGIQPVAIPPTTKASGGLIGIQSSSSSSSFPVLSRVAPTSYYVSGPPQQIVSMGGSIHHQVASAPTQFFFQSGTPPGA